MVMQMTSDVIIENNNNGGNNLSPIASLFKIGREQSYVTYEDILRFVPHPELNLDYIDRIFSCLLSAGIPFGSDQEHLEQIEGLVDKPDPNIKFP